MRVVCSRGVWLVVCALSFTVAAQPPAKPSAPPPTTEAELGLDLSSSSDVRAVLVLPPVVRVAASQGGFVGFDARKTVERLDSAAHRRLVAAFSKELSGKVIPVDATMGFLQKQGVIAAQLKVPGVLASLAKDTNVDWVIGFEFNKTGALVGTVYDSKGAPAGELSYVNNAAGIPQRAADDMATFVAKQVRAEAKKVAEALAAAAAAAKPAPPPAPLPPPEDEVDAELAGMGAKKRWAPDAAKVRAVASLGPGAAVRGLELGGEGAASLAELRNGAVVGLGVYVQVKPLELFESTAGKRFSDLALELNYRHAFVRAKGIAGSVAGEDCTMNDDDLQARATWRLRLGDNPMLPTIGAGLGWSSEATLFACLLPVVSTTWRGVDTQLRVRQPLYRDLVAIELAFGPRFLIAGPDASRPAFSFSGEAWLEVKPFSVLFARGGARVSRLTAANDSLSVVDTRAFFALEVGAFF